MSTSSHDLDPVALAHEVPDARTFERAVLDELRSLVGFDAAFFATKGELATTFNVDAARLDAAIVRVDYESEIAPLKAAALAARGVVVDTRVLGELAVRELAYHRDFAAPIGGRHSLLAFLAVRGRGIGGLMLGRSGGAFSDDHVAQIERLLPRLAIARASFGVRAEIGSGGQLPLSAPRGFARVADWIRGERVLERASDGERTIVVRDRAGHREMVFEGTFGELVWSRASVMEPDRSGWFYVDLLLLAATRARRRRRVLCIGSGGGVNVRQLASVCPGVALDLVESDPLVIELARRWFGLGDIPNLSITIDDGAAFLRRAPAAAWDAIIVDAFDGRELAAPFASRAFFADVRRTLRPGGGFALNVIGALGGAGVLQEVERAVCAELDDVRLVPVLDPGEAYAPMAQRNVVVLARSSTRA